MEIYPAHPLDDHRDHPVRDRREGGAWERRAEVGNGEADLLLLGAAIPPLPAEGEARHG